MITRLLIPFVIVVAALFSIPDTVESFTATGSMTTTRKMLSTTLLPNGKALVAGGEGADVTAELYDPASGTFSLTGEMTLDRHQHRATLLSDGKVLLTGGRDSHYTPVNKAELYNPATGSFSATDDMSSARYNHTATLLTNGKVLITGGNDVIDDHIVILASAELYDPSAGTFSLATASMASPRENHTATLLRNGKVLIAGGNDASGALDTAELYDPGTGQFSSTGKMNVAREDYTAILLVNGKVLLAGGTGRKTAELYDPATEQFIATGDMLTVRDSQTSTLLPNGKVLLTGGSDGATHLDTAELYDPDTGTFSSAGTMMSDRINHSTILLYNGKALIAGGEYYDGVYHDLDTAELYTPTSATFYRVGSEMQVYPSIQAAYDAMGSETLQLQALTFTGGLLLDHDLRVALAGGYASDFTLNSLYSVIEGPLIISAGTVTVERLIIN